MRKSLDVFFAGTAASKAVVSSALPTVRASTSGAAISQGRRSPFGWPVLAVPAAGEGSVCLFWEASAPLPISGWLRLTTAVDDRESRILGVRLAASHRPLGFLDLRHAHALETFALFLPPEDLRRAVAEGVELFLEAPSATPIWLLHPDLSGTVPGLVPSLLPDVADSSPVDALLRRLASPDSLHTWGWMEGCVLDALGWLDAAFPGQGYASARQLHLRHFFPPGGSLRAETARSEPCDDSLDSIESTLMFAALAEEQPDHPWLEKVTAWWMDRALGDGAILDGRLLTAEGSYTIAYPMARLAALRNRPDIARGAVAQIAARRNKLWRDGAFWLRWSSQSGARSFRNWSRGLAWHFLGCVRTAAELDGLMEIQTILGELPRLAELVLSCQREDGLWNCFVDDPTTAPETSGTAGLAAALALAARAGWIEEAPALPAAHRAHEALQPFIRPDGLLDGVAQSNRGGEELQRSSYRVLSSMGAGLFGQLHAALHDSPAPSRKKPQLDPLPLS